MTNGRLAGKTALVTGGAGGIGRAIVERFCAEGASVLIADIDEAQTQATAAAIARRGGTVIGHQADVADPEQAAAAVARAVEEFGTLQVLVNNAAHFGPHATVEDMLLENWARTLAVNLTGPFLMSKYAIPALRQAGGGSIIHIASQLGSVGRAQRSDYCSTKGALLQLARCMAADHAADPYSGQHFVARADDYATHDHRSRQRGGGAAKLRCADAAQASRPTGRDRRRGRVPRLG